MYTRLHIMIELNYSQKYQSSVNVHDWKQTKTVYCQNCQPSVNVHDCEMNQKVDSWIIYAQQVHYIKPYFLILLQHQLIETVRYVTGTAVGYSCFERTGICLPAGYAASLQAF